MLQLETNMKRRGRFSLSLRVSVLLVFSAILPLLIALATSELLTRPALTAQANLAMDGDAKAHVQLIDTYFRERLLDAETLSQVPSLQQFLATPPEKETNDLTTHALYGLAAGQFRDKNYTTWSLFDTQGQLRLYYPLTNKPQVHGNSLLPPRYLQAVLSGHVFVSDVYFDAKTNKASVDLYAPVALLNPQKLLGLIRATLTIDYIWELVKGEQGANGNGSYAFILDQNGVRIADAKPTQLFSAVVPLNSQVQQAINDEGLYGGNIHVAVLTDRMLADNGYSAHQSTVFQMIPTGQNEAFQATLRPTTVVPWKYVVVSPLNTITAVANQQLVITVLIAFSVLVLAALSGLLIGQRITNPILRSVEYLRRNSQKLTKLATQQKGVASEQTWVISSFIDSSQVGLQAMYYYIHTTRFSARRLHEMVIALQQQWQQLDAQSRYQIVRKIVTEAQRIEDAASSQEVSKQKLDTAVKAMRQVNEQLVSGATSAADASTQLELVVEQLRQVVGK